jgi:hypothetical protein
MKSTLLTLFSVIAMLTSCKCKKAMTDEVAVKEAQNAAPVMSNVDGSTLSTNSEINNKEQIATLLEYSANTRGYHLRIKWDGVQLAYTNQRDSEEFTKISLTSAQSDELKGMIKNLPLDKLASLKAPTEKRQYDGAAHADIRVVIDGKEYNSAGFDHGFPPAEIEKLVKKLVSYTEQK